MPGVAFKTKMKRARRQQIQEQKTRWQLQRDKPLDVTVREKLESLIDRIDPLELGASLGLTFLLLQSRDWITGLATQKPVQVAGEIANWFERLFGFSGVPTTEEQAKGAWSFGSAWMDFLITFAIAYWVIHNGKDIAGGVVSVAKGVIGL